MMLIVDSGSTKAHWCLLNGEVLCETVTQGLNPHFTDEGVMLSVFRTVRETLMEKTSVPYSIYFYGSGCRTREVQHRLCQLLQSVFPMSEDCHVVGDLLGACRATCGRQAGIVGILGTGSNLCYYDGTGIVKQRISTGFILGDEGSGVHIGKRLLKDYIEMRMPNDVRIIFHDIYGASANRFLDNVYHKPFPNRYLASFASFAAAHQDDPYIDNLLSDSFGSFFEQLDFFEGYEGLPLNLIGGIVGSFQAKLTQVAKERGIDISKTMPDPMAGLISYHGCCS